MTIPNNEKKWVIHEDIVHLSTPYVLNLNVKDSNTSVLLGNATVEIYPDLVYLRLIGVSREHRGSRIGSSLMTRVERLCEEESKYGVLRNEVSSGSLLAEWYQKRGWKSTSERRWLQYIPQASTPIRVEKPFFVRILELHQV